VICNGHYSEPHLPDLAYKAVLSFSGMKLHSHNYRDPELFRGMTVLVIGASNSGEDISREVAGVAERVYLSARSWKGDAEMGVPFGERNNISRSEGVSTNLGLTRHASD